MAVDFFRYRKWDLVSNRRTYYVISGLMLAVGVAALFYNKAHFGATMNWGIDFTGVSLVTYRVEGEVAASTHGPLIASVREELEAAGLSGSEVQVSPGQSGAGDQILVRVPKHAEGADIGALTTKKVTPAVTAALKKHASGAKVALESDDTVSGTVSRELVNQSVAAVILGSLLIMLWIGVRYNIGGFGLRYSVAGIVALLHDILTLVGMFALLRGFLEVNSPFIAALLTVLGYSIHDTIIIFDRIRENLRLRKGRTFAETVNISLLETLARSVNTVLTVILTLLALLFFGGPTLRDFVAAMLIGVAIGGYSSIFIASQLLVSWSAPGQKLIPSMEAVVAPVLVGDISDVATAGAGTGTGSSTDGAGDNSALRTARQTGRTARRRR